MAAGYRLMRHSARAIVTTSQNGSCLVMRLNHSARSTSGSRAAVRRELRVGLARLVPELLDQREDVAVVAAQQLLQVLAAGRPHVLTGVAPVALKVLAIWSPSSSRSVTITKLQSPLSLRSTFCVKNTSTGSFPSRPGL